MTAIKTDDVTSFFKDLIATALIFDIDDDGYVIRKNNGERVTTTGNGKTAELLVYQETIKDRDAFVINPLAEGQGDVPSTKWMYEVLKKALLGRIFTIFMKVIQTAIEEKKTKKDTKKDSHIPMELLSLAALIVDDVDDRLLEEFMIITSEKEDHEFLNIYYQKRQLRSILRVGLFDVDEPNLPAWRHKFGKKIRQKSWPVFEKIMLAILNIKDKDEITKFDKKASVLSCARFSSFLNILIAVYQEINSLLDIINPDTAIDLSRMVYHLEHLSAYTDNAKFFIQPTGGTPTPPVQQAPTQNLTPNIQPNILSPVPLGGQMAFPQQQMMPGVSLIPGPQYADGRQGPPIAVASSPQPTGYGQPAYGQPQMQPMMSGFPQQQMGYGYPQQGQMGYSPPNTIPFDGPYITMPQQPVGYPAMGLGAPPLNRWG